MFVVGAGVAVEGWELVPQGVGRHFLPRGLRVVAGRVTPRAAQGVFSAHVEHFGIGVGIVRLWCVSTGGVVCGFTHYGGSNLVLVVWGCWRPELDSGLIVWGHAEYVKEWV
jgi:hypothetical protein